MPLKQISRSGDADPIPGRWVWKATEFAASSGLDAKTVRRYLDNRWGHAYVCPAPGFHFGRGGKPAAPDVLRRPAGRVAFANADLHGHQNWADATAEGKRAIEQLFG